MNKAILVDVDGTLVSVTDFDYSVFDKGSEAVSQYLKVWDAKTMEASVYSEGVRIVKQFKEMGYTIVVLTARGQSCKKYTMKKFKEMGIDTLVDSVWHRPLAWEGKSSASYKEHMIKKLSKKFNFHFAMEDEDKNIAVMTAAGIRVLDAKTWW